MTSPFTLNLRRSSLSPFALLAFLAACSGRESGVIGGGAGVSSGSNVSGAAIGGTSGASSVGASGVTSGAVTSGSSTGLASGAGTGSESGVSSGASTGSSAGAAAAGQSSGSSGAPEAGASSGTMASGSSGGDDGGPDADATAPDSPFSNHRSAGCGAAPVGARETTFTSHNIQIPACGAGPITQACIAPAFAPGGVAAQTSNNGEDFTKRDYSIELPPNYDPSVAYPVFLGGGGCGGNPPQNGAGFNINETGAIKVGLSYVSLCFADGGLACAGSSKNVPLCVNTPEVPYLRAVLAEVEAKLCVDMGRVFIGGYETGAFEAITGGCVLADAIRGTVTLNGGLHIQRPPCAGPVAALMVVGEANTAEPVGPLASPNTAWDSYGSAAARDNVLSRNGCLGTATAPYDPNYPACVQYTGCPAAYPVVWCPLPGEGENGDAYNGVNYSPGSVQGDPLMWKFLSTLPEVP